MPSGAAACPRSGTPSTRLVISKGCLKLYRVSKVTAKGLLMVIEGCHQPSQSVTKSGLATTLSCLISKALALLLITQAFV